ncbi:MAG TPA: hypothetical protein VG435_11360 [Acidimicrobiales bacterium]|jgi:hypothetical protein|nr:hypothetical protein [Acidimicrobiales bacterium]
MTDDELIQRLRRSFDEQAENLQPTPGQVPSAFGAVGDQPTIVVPAIDHDHPGAPRPSGGEERLTAEYPLVPVTGPVPITSRMRRRWPPVAAGALATAAAVAIAFVLAGGRHPASVTPGTRTSTTPPSPSSVPASIPTTVPAPVPTTVARPTATTVPRSVTDPVPAGFQPFSITFVSPYDGWALGLAPCAAGDCAVVAATTDGGYSWSKDGAPAITVPAGDTQFAGGAPHFQVRFANADDGWAWTAPGSSQLASSLWSTVDGGATWTQVAVPFKGATIADLEASGGGAQLVAYGTCPAGTSGCQGQTVEELFTTPAGTDSWVASPLQPDIGAGPVLSPSLTLWGTNGWLVNDNRTTVSGAEYASGAWSNWTPPCASANGAGQLAAASATDLIAVCSEGTWGTPDAGTTAGHSWLFSSADGGRSFSAVAELPGSDAESISAAPGHPQTIAVADGQVGLEMSFDSGRSWFTAEPGTAVSNGSNFGYVGFTSTTQGVAVAYAPTPTVYMTRDGGHTWQAVSF